jgi:hypothetical protein
MKSRRLMWAWPLRAQPVPERNKDHGSSESWAPKGSGVTPAPETYEQAPPTGAPGHKLPGASAAIRFLFDYVISAKRGAMARLSLLLTSPPNLSRLIPLTQVALHVVV